jgi:oligopeptide/dipeptide ABC transporter ATP-binding protein
MKDLRTAARTGTGPTFPAPEAPATRRDTLLEVRDLRVHFPLAEAGKAVRAVDGVSLSLQAGETLALVGESGCGKSTLARAAVGLLKPTQGDVFFEGERLEPLGARSRRAFCQKLQMVFQDPDASLDPRLTVAAAVSEALELHTSLDRSARAERVHELLADVGLDPTLAARFPHELSGGQKQRVCIARALGPAPRLLVCDEAVSALDVSIQAQILNLLADLKERHGLSYLFITHDLRVVRHIADRVAVMYLGELVETAPVAEIFGAPAHPYTQALLAAVPDLRALRGNRKPPLAGEVPSPVRPPDGCRFHPRCPSAFARCRSEAPVLYPVGELGSRSARCFLCEPNDTGRPEK